MLSNPWAFSRQLAPIFLKFLENSNLLLFLKNHIRNTNEYFLLPEAPQISIVNAICTWYRDLERLSVINNMTEVYNEQPIDIILHTSEFHSCSLA